MKKTISIIVIAATMLALLAGCGASKQEAASNESGLSTVKAGTLTMATNSYFPPYEYYDGDAIVGIDADIAAANADKLGLELVI